MPRLLLHRTGGDVDEITGRTRQDSHPAIPAARQ
jgi:hypothetical protein